MASVTGSFATPDTELFDRHTHPVSLTDSGIRFVETAKQLVRLAYRVGEDFGAQKVGWPKITGDPCHKAAQYDTRQAPADDDRGVLPV